MRKRKDEQSQIDATEPAEQVAAPESKAASGESTPAKADASVASAGATGADKTSAIEPEIVDAPSIAPGDDSLTAEIAKAMSAGDFDTPAIGPASEPEFAKIVPITHVLVRADKVIDAEPPRRDRVRRLRVRRAMRLAATVAIAATVGAIAGSLSTLAVGGYAHKANDDAGAPRADLTRLDHELATLKSSADTSRKSTGAQLTRIT